MDGKDNMHANKNIGSRVPVQDRAKEKRARIVQAAFELFSERGYESVGMRDIAAAADVSIGTVYAYFSDKKEVFIAVFALYSDELKQSLFSYIREGLPNHPDIEEVVYSIIQLFFTIFQKHPKILRDCLIMSLMDDQVRSVYTGLERQGEDVVMRILLERFGDRIEIRDSEATRLVVHKTIDEITEYLLFYDVTIERGRILRETARMIARYLEKQ